MCVHRVITMDTYYKRKCCYVCNGRVRQVCTGVHGVHGDGYEGRGEWKQGVGCATTVLPFYGALTMDSYRQYSILFIDDIHYCYWAWAWRMGAYIHTTWMWKPWAVVECALDDYCYRTFIGETNRSKLATAAQQIMCFAIFYLILFVDAHFPFAPCIHSHSTDRTQYTLHTSTQRPTQMNYSE